MSCVPTAVSIVPVSPHLCTLCPPCPVPCVPCPASHVPLSLVPSPGGPAHRSTDPRTARVSPPLPGHVTGTRVTHQIRDHRATTLETSPTLGTSGLGAELGWGGGHQTTAAGYKYWLNRFIFIQRIHRSPPAGRPDPGGHPKMSPATVLLGTTSMGFTSRIHPHSQGLVLTLASPWGHPSPLWGHLGACICPVPARGTLSPATLAPWGTPRPGPPFPCAHAEGISGHFGVPPVP